MANGGNQQAAGGIAAHGVDVLSSVVVDSYNLEIRGRDGFVGDRASGRAFRATLDEIRKALRQNDSEGDPLGDDPSSDISKSTLDRLLAEGDLEAAGVVLGAIEHFAGELAHVARRFLNDAAWKGTERVVVGGGLKQSRVGELAVGRAMVLLKSEGVDIDMEMIRHHPDEAGLIGCAHLAPAWIYEGSDAILAVDVGGSNIRCGVVDVNLKKKKDLSKARVWKSTLWRHRDDDPKRDEAVARLTDMLKELISMADSNGRRLCPLIGVGVPGVIGPDGAIARGGQNLPGNWESSRFNLADCLREAIPEIGGHETVTVMHNDAVVQGLSQTPFMQDVAHWGVLTIGTGLGNARFTNRGGLEEN
ncbi:ROK family protein [Camelimonas sp. ID_303_24]